MAYYNLVSEYLGTDDLVERGCPFKQEKPYIPSSDNTTNLDIAYNSLKELCDNYYNYYDSEDIINNSYNSFFPNGCKNNDKRKKKENLVRKSLALGYNKNLFERIKDPNNKKKYLYRIKQGY